jgi:hypothetical protein
MENAVNTNKENAAIQPDFEVPVAESPATESAN